MDQSVPDFRENTSDVDTVSKTTSIVTVSPPPVRVDVSTQKAWTPVSASTQTASDCNVQNVHDHVYTFVKDKSQTLESYKDYVLQLESKLQAIEEECKHLMVYVYVFLSTCTSFTVSLYSTLFVWKCIIHTMCCYITFSGLTGFTSMLN